MQWSKIAQISVTGYGVAHIMVLSAVGQIKNLPTSILWPMHISKGNWTVKPDTTWYILQFELKVFGNKYY